jgi:hypothetical protein
MVVTLPVLLAVGVNESGPLDPIAALPFDGEAGIGLLQVDLFGVTVPGQADGKLVGDVEQPGITRVGGEQDELADADNPPVVIGGLVLDVGNLVGKAEALTVHHLSSRPTFDGSAAHSFSLHRVYCVDMERFIQLFADLLSLVYHCFDRIVIHGYLSGLSRPEQVVYFFRQVLGIRW